MFVLCVCVCVVTYVRANGCQNITSSVVLQAPVTFVKNSWEEVAHQRPIDCLELQ